MYRPLQKTKKQAQQRQNRSRQIVKSQPNNRPRLTVNISSQHIRAQVVDDQKGETLVYCSTLKMSKKGSLSERAEQIGQEVATACLKKKIKQVNFDRAGRLYHGRIKALAEAARQGGLDF